MWNIETAPASEILRGKAKEKRTRALTRSRLEEAVRIAAKENLMTPLQAAAVLSSFFEHFAYELCLGKCMIIPGIGAFCIRPTRPHPYRTGRLYVAYSAARSISVTAAEQSRFDEEAYHQFQTYRKNHRPSGRAHREIGRTPTGHVQRAWSQVGKVATPRVRDEH
jgi:nucleoid DNA-binding protein